jgi:signal transduction histidine kinase/ActR/RegA family two-component response regulator
MMAGLIRWLEAAVGALPLPLLEVWGRLAYLFGAALAICAFGGFTFRAGSGWRFGRQRQNWDARALWSVPLTFVLVTVSGWIGSFVVLVPGAQTLESLKDLAVFVCILCFGYPALLTVPFAYGVSDLVEGVPPDFLLDWLAGYFINPACFWIAYELFGKNPDFRRARTWALYALFVALFMLTEPILWGYVCADKFTPAISYRSITPALFFTTGVTWILAPLAMLGAWPLARRLGLFWAEIPDHVREARLGGGWLWESGREGEQRVATEPTRGMPIRLFILAPFIALVLLMVGAAAYVTLASAEDDATKLASRLHEEISENIDLRLDEYLTARDGAPQRAELDRLLAELPISEHGRAFVLDGAGRYVAESRANDAVIEAARKNLTERYGPPESLDAPLEFSFDHVTERPLARETWLTLAAPYAARAGRHTDWTVVTALPASYYLAGIRAGHSRSALVFAVALLLALAVAGTLASNVTNALGRTARATRTLALGDLAARVPGSHLAELDSLARSFNDMADELARSFAALKKEVETRKQTELELKASESRVRKSELRLEDLVRQRTLALERARDEADAANRAKSTFLANISHEIRTPMNAILGFGQLVERDAELSPENRDRVAKIMANGYHLLELINNVLALSKIEAGRMEATFAPADLVALVRGVDATVRRWMTEKGVAFRVEGLETVPRFVRTDAAKLKQILLNLLGNAAKFTTEGGVTLRLAPFAGGGTGARFEVEDTGVGIAEDELANVFEPFAQTKSGVVAQTGTGLGAAISRDFARLLGGELEVASKLGAGTTFVLTLPLEPCPAEDVASEGEPAGAVFGIGERDAPVRILVVDDERDNRALLHEILSKVGILVTEARDGARAVECFSELTPDLVLMDVKMPGVDGVEATRRIRAMPGGSSVPIVMLSASVFQEDRAEVLAGGGDAFIAKPFRESEIWDAVEHHLGLTLRRRPQRSSPPPGPPLTREEVQSLGPEVVGALRQALELGYVARVPSILAPSAAGHPRAVAELSQLARDLELETLSRLVRPATAPRDPGASG